MRRTTTSTSGRSPCGPGAPGPIGQPASASGRAARRRVADARSAASCRWAAARSRVELGAHRREGAAAASSRQRRRRSRPTPSASTSRSRGGPVTSPSELEAGSAPRQHVGRQHRACRGAAPSGCAARRRAGRGGTPASMSSIVPGRLASTASSRLASTRRKPSSAGRSGSSGTRRLVVVARPVDAGGGAATRSIASPSSASATPCGGDDARGPASPASRSRSARRPRRATRRRRRRSVGDLLVDRRTTATTLPSPLRRTARRATRRHRGHGAAGRAPRRCRRGGLRNGPGGRSAANRGALGDSRRAGTVPGAVEHERVAVVLEAQPGRVQPAVERVEHGRRDGDRRLDVEPGVVERGDQRRRRPPARPNLP